MRRTDGFAELSRNRTLSEADELTAGLNAVIPAIGFTAERVMAGSLGRADNTLGSKNDSTGASGEAQSTAKYSKGNPFLNQEVNPFLNQEVTPITNFRSTFTLECYSLA